MSSDDVDVSVSQPDEHDGDPAHDIDAYMNKFLRDFINAHAPNVEYWSEEERVSVASRPGDVVAWCDPLDGTTNALTSFGAYAVVVLFDECVKKGRRTEFEHLAGAIASSSGEIVSWQAFGQRGEVFIDWPAPFAWPTSESDVTPPVEVGQGAYAHSIGVGGRGPAVPTRSGFSVRLASVANNPERRRVLLAAFDLDASELEEEREKRPWLSTLGGNPLVAPLLLGELGGVIELAPSTKVHDGAFLIPLVLAGGYAVDMTGNDAFLWQRLSEPDPAKRLFPRFIAAVDDRCLEEIQSRVKRRELKLADTPPVERRS